MARIALIDPSGRAATTVEAVLGASHEIVVRPRIHAPGDVELVIADLRHADLVDPSTSVNSTRSERLRWLACWCLTLSSWTC